MRSPRPDLGRATWLVTTCSLAAITVVTVFGPLRDVGWTAPEVLFSLVTVAAAVCVLAATIVVALADRRELAEAGLLGSGLMGASVLPMVHGLVTPGVLYDDTHAFRTAAFLSLPIAIAVALPLLVPHTAFGRWAARHWRDWTLLALLCVFVVGSMIVFLPDVIVVPPASHPTTIAIAAFSALALGALSRRQLRLYELGRHPANLTASLSLVLLAVSALLPVSSRDYSIGFWWLHLAGALGVIGACVGMIVSKRISRSTRDVLGPVLARDPLVAIELGLSPVVHRFVGELERKDPATRDHVLRTAELAVRVGERFRLPARTLRDLGLAAVLHDVGKLDLPDEILKKPGRLSPEEFELVKAHTVLGEVMLRGEPTLASVAPYVRSHHERMDGRGYPDGLVGRDVPLPSRIIAVCDALDAMTHEREYRPVMSMKLALAVLRDHAGSQWDPAVIDQVMAVLPSLPDGVSLDSVGRLAALDVAVVDEMPEDLDSLLAAVDVEI